MVELDPYCQDIIQSDLSLELVSPDLENFQDPSGVECNFEELDPSIGYNVYELPNLDQPETPSQLELKSQFIDPSLDESKPPGLEYIKEKWDKESVTLSHDCSKDVANDLVIVIHVEHSKQ